MLEVKNLVKKYGGFEAVSDLNFSISNGEIVGFLGPNGAGKSTTMNMITGYISSTSGTIEIDGHEILEDPFQAKKNIGYLPEIPPLYLDMTVLEYLNFVFDLKKIKLNKKTHIDEVCKLVKIDHVSKKIIKDLSKGYKQRVGIAQALLGNPPLLILDEPTVGLDPKQIIEIRNLIKELGKSHTIILSSHILSEIQATCDRVIIINHGKIVIDENINELESRMAEENKFIFTVDGDQNKACSLIRSVDLVETAENNTDGEIIVKCKDGLQARRNIFKVLAEKDLPIILLRSASTTLEDIFLKITSDETNEANENIQISDSDQQDESENDTPDENLQGGND